MNLLLKSRLCWRNDQGPNFVVRGIVGMWVAVTDGSDDDDDMGMEEKFPFFMFSNIVAWSANNSSVSWDSDDGDLPNLRFDVLPMMSISWIGW